MSKETMKLALEAFKEIADETYDSWTNGAKAKRIAQAMIPKLEEALAKQEQDSTCNDTLRAQGKSYPRTCKKCGFGPCIGKPKQEQGEPVAWHQSKDGLPPVGSEVIGGHFYKDTWLKGEPEVFGWGRCTVIADNHPDFHEGKRWITFGPSHNQISHWCWPPQKPSDTTPQQRKPLTDEQIVAGGKALAKLHADTCGLDFDDVWKYYAEDHKADAKVAIEAAHGIKE